VEEGERGEEGDSENNVTTPNRESAASVQLQAAHVLITSSKGEEAWGDKFTKPLVEQLKGNETDVCTILEKASDDAEKEDEDDNEDEEKPKRKQTIQRPTHLKKGDITL